MIKIEKELLTIKETAELLSMSRFTIYRMIKDGRLERTKLGNKSVRVFGKSLEAFINQNTD